MGNTCSSKKSVRGSCCFCPTPTNKKKQTASFTPIPIEPSESDRIVTTVLQVLFPPAVPLLCKLLSKIFINNPRISVLKYEAPHTVHTASLPMEEQVIKDIGVQLSKISLLSEERLMKDMKEMPSFHWPEKENIQKWMICRKNKGKNCKNDENDDDEAIDAENNNNSSDSDESENTNPMEGNRMTVLDLNDLELQIWLGEGIEFEIPLLQDLKVEVGCGGKTIGDNAYIKVSIPKLRVWVVRKKVEVEIEAEEDGEESGGEESDDKVKPTKMEEHVILYLGFFGRPIVKPYLHYNLDNGNGDFWNGVVNDNGSLKDIVESILQGFGPTQYEDHNNSILKVKNEDEHLSMMDKKYWTKFFGPCSKLFPLDTRYLED